MTYTGLVVELEHLEIKLRSTREEFTKAMGECTIQTLGGAWWYYQLSYTLKYISLSDVDILYKFIMNP